MNSEEPTLRASERVIKTRLIVGAVAGAVVVLVLILIYGMRTPTRATTEAGVRETDKLDGARRDLAKSTDVGTCRNVVQQINLYLSDHAKRRPPALTAEQRAFLGEQCLGNASDNEMAEVAGEAFTLLDGHYLAECFLFHDAAMSLEVGGRPSADRADAAFRWTVRQIRLQEMAPPAKPDVEPDPVPPEFVARRGWGTAMERALVFLALLRQLGVEGCLIVSPSAANGPPLCWACGALVEANEKEPSGKKDILLFDPRLGIPLPGPHGEGIATLANLREHPDELKALTVNSDFPYDVTPEQVAGAAIELVEPLSALSPRMAALQKDLLGPTIKARLALDPKESLDRWVAVATPLGVPVRIGTRWTGVWRRFLPPDEGGSDKGFGFSFPIIAGFPG